MIKKAIGSTRGIGELMVYDTALRIGANLGFSPERIYLHCGTREGARTLGLDWRRPYLNIEDVPRQLRKLKPHEIEDCLCIFKTRLGK